MFITCFRRLAGVGCFYEIPSFTLYYEEFLALEYYLHTTFYCNVTVNGKVKGTFFFGTRLFFSEKKFLEVEKKVCIIDGT